MYRNRNGCGSIIIGLVVFYWLGLGLLYLLGIKKPSDGETIGAFVVVFVGFIGIGAIVGYIDRVYKRWKRCPHGVLGGISQDRCNACTEEKKAREEKYQKQREIEKQQQSIRTSANELRNKELIRLSTTFLPSLDELRNLTSQRFEDAMAIMFKELGYNVKQTPYSGDAGKDAILWKEGEKYLLECKRYSSDRLSGRPELQKFHSAIISEAAIKGFFVTTGGFSSTAVKFAKNSKIELVHGNRLVQYLLDSKPKVSGDDSYDSKCLECGDLVQHQLRNPRTGLCRNNHPVEPTLILDKILGIGPDTVQICPKCSAPMHLINGRNGKFWGCTKYPSCRSTKRWRA
ncbi:MAG: restriction endonuclease [Desulfobaccales bacterium]